MKELYTTPEITLEVLERHDVLCSSSPNDPKVDNHTIDNGGPAGGNVF